jgi:hypothetical protein
MRAEKRVGGEDGVEGGVGKDNTTETAETWRCSRRQGNAGA